MTPRAFQQVDVFTDTPYLGNPLAVVLDGTGLSTEAMQRFTDWTNLSECTFVLPPANADADYRVRIFCPGRELPFAGHPTLGTCHAWLQAGGQPRGEHVVQECGVGLVRIKRDDARLAFAAPPLRRSGPLDEADLALIARGLGIPREDILAHAWCENGPPWRGVMLRSATQLLALKPNATVLAGLDIGVVAPKPAGADTAFEVRAFFHTHETLSEDPVTGSLNAAVAQWLIGAGLAPDRYVAAQGTAMGRAGRVHIERDADGTIWVGGASVTCISGQVVL
ncbi:phenazine biosynthesis, PhzF family protein [Hydrogenophaga sp. RAC07]|uniref:PhzF family phenazine biosynthesis protein n=1 Tax=Hydrogenophaga sp. RAC07 TaxID=1842537 RepID=UPI00083DCF83|nr:PhzF family phenazine biosynthesis protein [Hydrogenophaga sp. RAC07]AOF86995.1 phenazine biosynthesis, PhzF family protein [Hydrogenophaga sp. RAC07]